MRVLVTGGAGFIGSRVAKKLADRGDEVIALDNFNDYYVVSTGDKAFSRLKEERVSSMLGKCKPVFFCDVANKADLGHLMRGFGDCDAVIHLAAQAGVRFSEKRPELYERSNVTGTRNTLELARELKIKRVIYASTSSVYGSGNRVPFSEDQPTDRPVSLYAATKKAGELLAYNHYHNAGGDVTVLRFFTVYGPWGRPDMANILFPHRIMKGQPILVYDGGKLKRDFTFIDDIVAGVVSALDNADGYSVYNLGNNHPIEVNWLIELVESRLGRKAKRLNTPAPPYEMRETFADITRAQRDLGFFPKTGIEDGVASTVDWYLSHFHKDEAR